MVTFSSKNRAQLLDNLQKDSFELLIIGGGITGAGIALDAASRGIKTALVEKGDFASGTSSKSTKLIHGGLRYLGQGDFGLVQEVGKERAIVFENAPHLVVPEKMLLPLVKGGTYGRLSTALGLTVYDLLAAVKKEERRSMLSKNKVLELEPLLNKELTKSGCVYSEYRTDDARLTIEILKTATNYEALPINYIEVTDLAYNGDKVCGAKYRDVLTGDIGIISANYTVNAAGPWVDKIRNKDNSLYGKRVHHTKGVHLVVPKEKLPVNHALYFDAFDGRMIFAIPRGKITYFGTTDTNFDGTLESPTTSKEDVSYLLKAINNMFPSCKINKNDISSSWAGIRPLIHQEGKAPSEISRKDEIFESQSGLLSIAGGKLTGYRKMAKRIVDKVCISISKKGKEHHACKTENISLGSKVENVEILIDQVNTILENNNLHICTAEYLVRTYGIDAKQIAESAIRETGDMKIGLGISELRHCLNKESIHKLSDFFIQRTGRLYFDIESISELLDVCCEEMANHLNWNNSRKEAEKDEILKLVEEATLFL